MCHSAPGWSCGSYGYLDEYLSKMSDSDRVSYEKKLSAYSGGTKPNIRASIVDKIVGVKKDAFSRFNTKVLSEKEKLHLLGVEAKNDIFVQSTSDGTELFINRFNVKESVWGISNALKNPDRKNPHLNDVFRNHLMKAGVRFTPKKLVIDHVINENTLDFLNSSVLNGKPITKGFTMQVSKAQQRQFLQSTTLGKSANHILNDFSLEVQSMWLSVNDNSGMINVELYL